MKQSFGTIENRQWPRVLFAFSFGVLSVWMLARSLPAQTSTGDSPQVIRGITEQGFAYMTGGVGTAERKIMQSWGGGYNLKLAFVEMSGEYLPGVDLLIVKYGREMVRETANGPWFYIELPPGEYTVNATYDDETKQIKNLKLVKDGRITRIVRWDLEEES